MTNTKKITICAVFTAVAIILSVAESYIPTGSIAPGVKLGLANIVPLTLLYVLGPSYAITVQLVRILITGLLRGNFTMFVFSFLGGMCSVAVMALIKKYNIPGFSAVGISIIGATVHNAVQFAVAVVLLNNINISWYAAVLTIFAVLSGLLTGIVGRYAIKRMDLYLKRN
jgi:heptaprenyl diphosphate synthase